MTPPSAKTRQHVETLFAPEDRAAAEQALFDWLEAEHRRWLESHERLLFAALRLSGGDLAALADAINLGKKDYRDLLMAADFGFDVHAHESWVPRRFTPQLLESWLAGGEIEDVNFHPADVVHLRSGWALGPRATIKTLVAIEPEPTYTVALADGSERRVLQWRLQRAD